MLFAREHHNLSESIPPDTPACDLGTGFTTHLKCGLTFIESFSGQIFKEPLNVTLAQRLAHAHVETYT